MYKTGGAIPGVKPPIMDQRPGGTCIGRYAMRFGNDSSPEHGRFHRTAVTFYFSSFSHAMLKMANFKYLVLYLFLFSQPCS